MTESPRVGLKRCEVTGCPTPFAARGSRRRCVEHRARPWIELWVHRVAAGLTVRELAEQAGIRDIYVHALQSGVRAPGERHVAALAQVLGVAPAALTPSVDTPVPADLPYVVGGDPARLVQEAG